ncbi:MAG: hypothetical protein ABH879_04500 [archaeon]
MNAYNLERFTELIESWGISEVMLPFLLLFIIFYAMLSKSKVLGEANKGAAVVAIALSLTVVVVHVTQDLLPNRDPVVIINKAMPIVAIYIVALVMALILTSALGSGKEAFAKHYNLIPIIIINIMVANVYPTITRFILIVSIILVINTIIGTIVFNRSSTFSWFGSLIGITFFLVLTAFLIAADPSGELPDALLFLENDKFQGFFISALVMLLVVRLVAGDSSSEYGGETYRKIFNDFK